MGPSSTVTISAEGALAGFGWHVPRVPAQWLGFVQIVPSQGTVRPSPFGFGIVGVGVFAGAVGGDGRLVTWFGGGAVTGDVGVEVVAAWAIGYPIAIGELRSDRCGANFDPPEFNPKRVSDDGAQTLRGYWWIHTRYRLR